ncbi:ATP-binding protein [uncultured Ruegeria sp.]|uniref:ATP-binding protein n=1 Tax=uncultured Ruegeria sp. TaxID=259304 RepID=UPI00261BB083|nr:ATP-binding protein [uncultured Ruegeria sp.]
MALSLSNLVRKTPDKPPITVIYGRGKMGKTTLASEFPNPIFIQTEDGAGNLELTSFKDEPLVSLSEVNEALVALASEDHDFKTLVVDSVTQLEPLIWGEVCQRNSWRSIEDPGYGKGYIEADVVWREFLAACAWLRDNKRMNVVLIAHEVIENFSDPEREDYNRYKVRLHKRAEAMIRERADIVGFINQVVVLDKGKSGKDTAKAKGSGQRALNLSPKPTFEAGNRYDMPDKILINAGEGYAAIARYLPGQPGETAAKAA